MVNVFFFKTLGRLCLAAFVLIGPVEYALHLGVQQYPDLSNAHYNFTINTSDEVPVPTFVPADPACRLPPSQPYAFQLGVNGAKMTTCAVVLGGIPEDMDAPVPLWQKAAFYIMTAYQWIMVPITMVLTIVHFARYMGPFQSWWQGYECFGILWTLGPWFFNIWFMFLKFGFQFGAAHCDPLWSHTRFSRARGVFTEPLMATKDVERSKGTSFAVTVLITLMPYLIIWLPFVLTHILPAMVIFLPQNVLIFAVFAALTWCIWFDSEDRRKGFGHHEVFVEMFANEGKVQRMLEKAAGLHFLPFMAGTTILAEVLMLEAVYYYAGDGWFNSMAEAWLERRSDYYYLAFKQMVLDQYYAFADLLNEGT